jgi:hypothetical protein
MDIEQFYDADELRRDSEELELGAEWRDTAGHLFSLSYVIDTHETYLMAMPGAELIEDPFGDMAVDPDEPIEEMTVEIIASVPSTDELHEAITGWEEQMAQPNSIGWLRDALRSYAIA